MSSTQRACGHELAPQEKEERGTTPEQEARSEQSGLHDRLRDPRFAELDRLIAAEDAALVAKAAGAPEGKPACPRTALPASDHPALTPRDREVLELVSKGFSDREIALNLGKTPKTISIRLYHIRRKTGAKGGKV